MSPYSLENGGSLGWGGTRTNRYAPVAGCDEADPDLCDMKCWKTALITVEVSPVIEVSMPDISAFVTLESHPVALTCVSAAPATMATITFRLHRAISVESFI